MKSQIKLDKDDVADFYNYLTDNGYEVNTERVDWRVMMFRKKGESEWTQAYDGLTHNAKAERSFLRVFGKDQGAVAKFKKEKNA